MLSFSLENIHQKNKLEENQGLSIFFSLMRHAVLLDCMLWECIEVYIGFQNKKS